MKIFLLVLIPSVLLAALVITLYYLIRRLKWLGHIRDNIDFVFDEYLANRSSKARWEAEFNDQYNRGINPGGPRPPLLNLENRQYNDKIFNLLYRIKTLAILRSSPPKAPEPPPAPVTPPATTATLPAPIAPTATAGAPSDAATVTADKVEIIVKEAEIKE